MIKRSVGVHDGTFHADEVVACALLVVFNLVDKEKIIRTRNFDKLNECEFLCDVGGYYSPKDKKFDHHQSSYKEMLSSAGMILKYLYDESIITKDLYKYFNDNIVFGVDQNDNGIPSKQYGVCSFSNIISNFNPYYGANAKEQNKAFFEALDFAIGYFQRSLNKYKESVNCLSIVKKAMQKGVDYLFFDKQIPWIDNFFSLGGESHPAKFVIMPSIDGWKLRGIPPSSRERMKVRFSLPEEWGGLMGKDLELKANIDGAVFCHKGLFISIWKTKESALKAYELTMKSF